MDLQYLLFSHQFFPTLIINKSYHSKTFRISHLLPFCSFGCPFFYCRFWIPIFHLAFMGSQRVDFNINCFFDIDVKINIFIPGGNINFTRFMGKVAF